MSSEWSEMGDAVTAVIHLRRGLVLSALGLALAAIGGCAHRGPGPVTTTISAGAVERGLASWYGEPYHGRRTASGEVYDMHAMTAAHRTLPFHTVVRVTRRDSGAAVEVRINDRGPFIKGRIIDLSYAAAKVIGLDVDGVAPVVVEILRRGGAGPAPAAARPPDPPPAVPAAPGCLWIQVGAFADMGNASRVLKALLDAGARAVIVEGPGGLHRVRVGPFSAPGEAERDLPDIRERYPAAAIISCGG